VILAELTRLRSRLLYPWERVRPFREGQAAVRPTGGSDLVTRGWTGRSTANGEPGAMAQLGFERGAPTGTDTAAFQEGYIPVTPLQFEWTDRAALAELDNWELSVH
jgi:broad specificity polyphosphatase/5'/3'-nucleotidase SurE